MRSLKKTIDSTSKKELEQFNEIVHRAYVSIAKPFLSQQIYKVPFRPFWDMLETTEECTRLTGYRFDKGLEYSNLSVAEVGLGNLKAGFSHMELAQAEDSRIGHKTGVARTNLQYILDNAYTWIDGLMARSSLSNLQQAKLICERKLDWTEKCRLAKSMWKFGVRIRDDRSSLNNEDLERNLLNICRVVENYLKRKNPMPNVDPQKQRLTPLVNHAFRTQS